MDYDFAANQDILLGIVLGDLDPDILESKGLTLTLQNWREPFGNSFSLGLELVVNNQALEPPKKFCIREAVLLHDMENFHLGGEQFIWKTYHSIARKISRKLFEVDPRIGMPLTKKFPDCPLFDPPYIETPYEHYLTGKGPSGVFTTLTTCHFCMQRIYPYGDGVLPGLWCGGNVGFAHEDCAPWAKSY
jgi:hypothetical protein